MGTAICKREFDKEEAKDLLTSSEGFFA